LQIGHAKKNANFAMHGLAKAATKQVMDYVWIKETLMCIYDIITLIRVTCSIILAQFCSSFPRI
jgi:hypothetical protein